MSSSSRIDLLAFPDVVLRRTLLSFDNTSFFNFSMCSKSSHGIAKAVVTRRKPNRFKVEFNTGYVLISMRFLNGSKLFIEGREFSFSTTNTKNEKERYTIDGIRFYAFQKRHLLTYWNEEIEMFKMVEYLEKLFNYALESMDINYEIDRIPRNIEKIISAAPAGPMFSIKSPTITNEEYVFLLNNAKSDHLRITQLNEGCERLLMDTSCAHFRHFCSNSAFWITLEQIMNWKFNTLQLYDTKMTSEEVNTVLKNWKKGWNSGMKELSIGLRDGYSFNHHILSGLNAKRLAPCYIRRYDYNGSEHSKYPIFSGFEMKRDDGTIALIDVMYRKISVYFGLQRPVRR